MPKEAQMPYVLKRLYEWYLEGMLTRGRMYWH